MEKLQAIIGQLTVERAFWRRGPENEHVGPECSIRPAVDPQVMHVASHRALWGLPTVTADQRRRPCLMRTDELHRLAVPEVNAEGASGPGLYRAVVAVAQA